MSIKIEAALLAVQRFTLGAAFSVLAIAGSVALLGAVALDLIGWD